MHTTSAAHDLPDWRVSGFWGFALGIWANITSQFGTPTQIASQPYLDYFGILDLRRWVHALELYVRRLIVAAALAFDPGPLPLRVTSTAPRARNRRRYCVYWPNKPEKWRVRFRMMPRARGDGPRRPRNPYPRRGGVFDTWPLALRLQAILNVIESPNARVRNFARALARFRVRALRSNTPRMLALRPLRAPRTAPEHILYERLSALDPHARDALARWEPPEPD